MIDSRFKKMAYAFTITIFFLGAYYLSETKGIKSDYENDTKKNAGSKVIPDESLKGVRPQSRVFVSEIGGAGKPEKNENSDKDILAQLISIVPNENKSFPSARLVHDISKDARLPLGDISLLSADDSFSLYKSLLMCETFNTMSWVEMRDFRSDFPSLPVGIDEEFKRKIKACEPIDKKDYQQTYRLLLHAARQGYPSAKIDYARMNRVWVGDKYKIIRELETSTRKEEVKLEEEIFSYKVLFLKGLQKDDYHMSSFELGELYASRGKHQDRIKALMSYLIFYAEMPNANNAEEFISSFISDTMRPVDIQLAIDDANDYLANKYQK